MTDDPISLYHFTSVPTPRQKTSFYYFMGRWVGYFSILCLKKSGLIFFYENVCFIFEKKRFTNKIHIEVMTKLSFENKEN